MEEMVKEMNAVLERDFPNAKLALKVPPAGKPAPTTAEQIAATIAELQTLIRVLEEVRKRL